MNRQEMQAIVDECPFHRFLAMTVVSVDPDAGEVVLLLPFRPEFSRSSRELQVHGGITAALIDIAGDYAVAARTGHGVPTINLRIDYLRMVGPSALTARAIAIKVGRAIGVVDIEVHDEDRRLVAVGRANYSTAA